MYQFYIRALIKQPAKYFAANGNGLIHTAAIGATQIGVICNGLMINRDGRMMDIGCHFHFIQFPEKRTEDFVIQILVSIMGGNLYPSHSQLFYTAFQLIESFFSTIRRNHCKCCKSAISFSHMFCKTIVKFFTHFKGKPGVTTGNLQDGFLHTSLVHIFQLLFYPVFSLDIIQVLTAFGFLQHDLFLCGARDFFASCMHSIYFRNTSHKLFQHFFIGE